MAMRLGIIGMGAIGREMMRCIDTSAGSNGIEVVAVQVTEPARHAGSHWPLVDTVDALLDAGPELVVECASQVAFSRHVPRVLAAGCNVVAGSVGALADAAIERAIRTAADQGNSRLHIPAGALAGIDALAAAKLVGISTVEYARSAPPSTWADHDAARGIDLSALTGPHLVYEGSARDAARRFPKNANVAAIIALAGIGFERTTIRIYADPALTGNLHTLRAEGAFGRLHTEIASTRIGTTSSSKIVAGSLARSVLFQQARIVL